MFTLDDVLIATRGRLVSGTPLGGFSGVAIDSRTLERGELFVAFRGQKHDGHDFVLTAFAHGAHGALVDRLGAGQPWARPDWDGPPVILTADAGVALEDLAAYWRRRHTPLVVGVTGSVGKTTTKEFIATVLGTGAAVLRTPANLNTEIGVPLSLMRLTPAHQVVVVEMGMHDLGEIRRLAQIAQPQIGVVTNVQESHLERLGTLERIAAAKRELVEELPAEGLALINADDPRVSAMAGAGPARVTRFGLDPKADLWADDLESHGLQGIEFTVHRGDHRARARMRVPGIHSVHGALAAVGVALEVGMDFDEAVGALRQIDGGLRLLVTAGARGATVLDDTYNANPASMLAALNLLSEMEGRRVAVLGDMLELGSYEEEGHRLVGVRAAETTEWLLTIGPRARRIAAAAIEGGMPPDRVESYETREEVVARLRAGLLPGDFVLVKGSRGMHLDEVVRAIHPAA